MLIFDASLSGKFEQSVGLTEWRRAVHTVAFTGEPAVGCQLSHWSTSTELPVENPIFEKVDGLRFRTDGRLDCCSNNVQPK